MSEFFFFLDVNQEILIWFLFLEFIKFNKKYD